MNRTAWRPVLVPVFLLGTALSAFGAEIRDSAGLFSPEARAKAKIELERIETAAKLPITIETLEGLNGRTIDQAIPERAESLGIRGLFVLIAKQESKIEASASREYAPLFPVDRRRSIESAFVSEFKNRRFDDGLTKGVAAIDSAVGAARNEAGGSLQPAQNKGTFGFDSVVGIILVVLAVIVVFRLIGSLFGGRRDANYGPNMGMGGRPMGGGPGYGPGAPGYGYGGGGGGGFFSSLFGGIGGAMAGNWLYDQFTGRHHSHGQMPGTYDQGAGIPPAAPQGSEWTQDGGTDFGGGSTGGSDWGSGGGGGSDWGGSSGGADWGGSTGGGDWGGGGGGDWGGGGGSDWGGGGGDDAGGGW
jgi:uncharacterized protein